jgi:predicted outer membrane repeat protein
MLHTLVLCCVLFTQSQFVNNTASVSAGAIGADSGSTLTVDTSRFNHNSARSGGAIQASDACVTITDSIFGNNTAADSGGAVLLETDSTDSSSADTDTDTDAAAAAPCVSSVLNTTFAMNSAATGGAISTSTALNLREVRIVCCLTGRFDLLHCIYSNLHSTTDTN